MLSLFDGVLYPTVSLLFSAAILAVFRPIWGWCKTGIIAHMFRGKRPSIWDSIYDEHITIWWCLKYHRENPITWAIKR